MDLYRSASGTTMNVEVGIALNSLAEAERMSGDLDAAERDFRKALKIARAMGYSEGVAIYTGNLGELALDRQDWPAAEALAREALGLAEDIGRQELIGDNCDALAKALMEQAKPNDALPYAQRGVDICTRLNSPKLGKVQATLAECEAQIACPI